MAFNTYTFFIFFAVVLALHYSSFSWRLKKINLLGASYLFYAAWHPPFVVLLIICTLADWFASKGIASTEIISKRRLFLILALLVDLGMLGFFKYANFFLDNFTWLMNSMNVHYQPPKMNILLPLGISFFTFQSLTYTFDIYRRKSAPWPSFMDFALFVAFFPKLVIGPITRASDFLQQCKTPFKADMKTIYLGLTLLLLGLFEKMIMADNLLAPVADQLFDKAGVPDTLSAWAGSLAYTGQIFFDFAGYSTCAIGTAMCFGVTLPQNFKYPYAAIGFSDFWRRWHISLSSWLRDYLYIPLGGNKKGTFRTYINLMLTMLLGGLWHGASWTFVVWGGLHGFYLVIERILKKIVPSSTLWLKLPTRLLFMVITFLLISLAWIFFRSVSFEQAFSITGALIHIQQTSPTIFIDRIFILSTFILTFFILVIHWFMRDRSLEQVINIMPWWMRSVCLAALIIILLACSGDDRAFIYFQF
jgi:D-alanyl-lipoteichoic acid acyltransferase DltB (MBOAT superfamily)